MFIVLTMKNETNQRGFMSFLITFRHAQDNLSRDTKPTNVTDDIPDNTNAIVIWKNTQTVFCAKCRINPIHKELTFNFEYIFCLSCINEIEKKMVDDPFPLP